MCVPQSEDVKVMLDKAASGCPSRSRRPEPRLFPDKVRADRKTQLGGEIFQLRTMGTGGTMTNFQWMNEAETFDACSSARVCRVAQERRVIISTGRRGFCLCLPGGSAPRRRQPGSDFPLWGRQALCRTAVQPPPPARDTFLLQIHRRPNDEALCCYGEC